MCGLAAFFEPGRRFDGALLDAVDRDLFHRGPDSGGRLSEPGCGLVFRRLAILDPKPVADQPMTDADGNLTLIFNGEIYNFRELQRKLRAAHVVLRTDGDTETILEGYRLWGASIFARLEGMFALVLVDRRNGVAIAARDPFGIKPLYMARRGTFTGVRQRNAAAAPTGGHPARSDSAAGVADVSLRCRPALKSGRHRARSRRCHGRAEARGRLAARNSI